MESEVEWDMQIEGGDIDYRALIEKAVVGTLDTMELWKLVETFKLEPELVFECGLTPDKFPTIVQSCPDLALGLLVSLDSHAKKSEYPSS